MEYVHYAHRAIDDLRRTRPSRYVRPSASATSRRPQLRPRTLQKACVLVHTSLTCIVSCLSVSSPQKTRPNFKKFTCSCAGVRVGVWILAQGQSWSPNFLKSRSWSPAKKGDCFWIFMFVAVPYNFCATGLDLY